MKIDKKAFKESVTDTMLGLAINFPMVYITLSICLLFTTDAFVITVVQTIVITIIAIIRRYATRLWFKQRNGD
jgi:ABC-type protease/lipase transport system fused ATPase/permease subunit